MKKLRKFTFTVVGSIVVYEALRKTGALDKIKGDLKQRLGQLLDNPKLQLEGSFDEGKGIVKEVTHDVKEKVEDLVEED